MVVLSARGVCKSFVLAGQGDLLPVLDNVDLDLLSGQTFAIIGPSGRGKTTLLQVLGLLDELDSGSLSIDGLDCTGIGYKRRCAILAKKIGFVYQFHHLLPEFTAIENVRIGCLVAGFSFGDATNVSRSTLVELGLGDKLDFFPNMLSGGERQRIAIARAVAKGPKILLADEPTGNLDPRTGELVMNLLLRMVRSRGLSLLCVTHNADLANKMDRVVAFDDLRGPNNI